MNIIERLRIADISYHPLNFDAIKEIERLQAENTKFKELLLQARQEIIRLCGCYPPPWGLNKPACGLLEAIDAAMKGGE